MKSITVRKLTFCAIIGAIYAALTVTLAPISYGPLQFRISEALCVIPFFVPEAAWGLFVGCALANLIGGYGVLDVVFGSLATLIAGLLTARIRVRWLACLPPVAVNGLVIGGVLAYVLTPDSVIPGFLTFSWQVAAGEAAVMYIIGLPMLYWLPRAKFFSKMLPH